MPTPGSVYSPPSGAKTFNINKDRYYTYTNNGVTSIVNGAGFVVASSSNGTKSWTFSNNDPNIQTLLKQPNNVAASTAKSTVATTSPNVATPAAAPTNPTGAQGGNPTSGNPTSGINQASLEAAGTNIAGKRLNKYPKQSLVYPLKRQGYGGDYIQFEIRTYEKSGLASPTAQSRSNTKDVTLLGMEQRNSTPLAYIYLPIQSGIVDSMSVDWGSGELNPITAAFANLAYNTINRSASGDLSKMLTGLGKEVQNLGKSFGNASPELRQMMVNFYVQEAVNTPGLLSRTVGGALNNNLELLFNGPMLRSFTFNFKLTPREPKESEVIKDIIRYFKKSMVPGLSDSKLFLLAPNVFKIKYIYTGKGNTAEPHPYLNKIKVAALRDFSVNYTPDGNYMTYDDPNGLGAGSMTQYDLSMTFGEIDPIYEPDYEQGEGLTGVGW
jgi:hypothetical protein